MKSLFSLCAGFAALRATGGNSVVPRFLASSEGILGVCRGERARPRLAALALTGLLLGQTLVPCGILLSSVRAAELRVAGKSGAKAPGAAMPAWAKQGAGMGQREANLQLAQLAPKDQGGGKKAKVVNEAECLDCEVSLEPLDLSKVPSERALRRSGGRDGALYPMRRGDAEELGLKLDRLLKRVGIKNGLRDQLPPKDPRYAALTRARERYERAQAINVLFGRAVKEWREGDRAKAARLFGEYMEKYPQTPWAGESALHLGYAAKDEGRLIDAVGIFEEVLDKTSDEPNEKLREAKRQRNARGGDVADGEREADISRALEGALSLEAAVDKLDSSKESDDDDESFEIHMKAKQQLADIELAMGHYGDASEKMLEIMKEDTDWHRRVWARKQLQRANALASAGAPLMACGPQALGMVMVGLHKDAAAGKVKAAVAKDSQGFSMAELRTLAAKNGVAMRGFRADVRQLPRLALPAILHYDYGRDSKGKIKNSGHFVVLQGVDSKGAMVRLFDPLTKSSSRLSFAQLERQWSGQGLAVAGANARLVGASLDERAMQAAVGSSTTASSDLDMGANDANVSVGVGDGVNAPNFSVHQASLNVYAQHTVMAYQPTRGPAVNITLSYNSDGGTGYGANSPFGDKWTFNYASQGASFFRPDSQGRNVQFIDLIMPDGTKKIYREKTENGRRFYDGLNGDFTYVEIIHNDAVQLVFPDGTLWRYDTLSGRNDFCLTKITDVRGASIQLGYDYSYINGRPKLHRRLVHIEDATGKFTRLQYHNIYDAYGDQLDIISSATDPFGRTAYFSYNGNTMLSRVTDQGGRNFVYGYDNGLRDIVSVDLPVVDAAPNAVQKPWRFKREYPNPSRPGDPLLTVTNPLDENEGFSHDSSNGRWFHVMPNRYAIPYNHYASFQKFSGFVPNVLGKLVPTRVNYADGTYITYRYERQNGLPDQIVDRQGQTTTLSYNEKGQVTSVTDGRNITTTTEYASNKYDPIRFIQPKPDGSGSVIAKTVTYNNYHQPTSVTDVDGTTTFEYTAWGALELTTDPQNFVTRNVYNAQAQLSAVQRSSAPVNGAYSWVTLGSLTYDSKERVREVTDAAQLKTTYDYNDADRVTKTVYQDGTFEEVLYRNAELPVRVRDRAGRFSYAQFDALKRVRRSYVQDPQNNSQVGTTQTDYDRDGNLTQLTDTKGNLTRWAYDALDRATGKQYHDGTSESYNYELLANGATPTTRTGRLASATSARNITVHFHYDANGNQTKIDYPNTPDVTMGYNALDQPSSINDGIGTHTMSYDDYGRLVSSDGPLSADTQTYAYDNLGRIQTQTVERGASGGVQSQSYAYDGLGRLTGLNANGTQGTGLTTYAYDGNTDRLRLLSHPNGTKTDLRYDAYGRLTFNFNGANGNPLHNRYAYGYNANDSRSWMQTRTGAESPSNPLRSARYTYDALDQLKQENVDNVVTGSAPSPYYTANYNYDAMGNRLQTDRSSQSGSSTTTSTPNALNQLTSITTNVAGGPTTSANLTYDATGNLTQSAAPNGTNRTVYTYDDADRLSRIERRGDAGQLLTISEFAYDYASRRAFSRDYDFTSGGGGWANPTVKRRVFDGLNVVQERDSNNQVSAQLVRDGNIAGILSRTTAAGASFYGYDGTGNVTLLTNSAGQDVGHYRYDAFGQTLEAEGPRAGENPYRFSTKELHGASGLYDFGLRFYSPGMGRWISRDPIHEAGGVNLYVMVGNSPTNYVDFYGLARVEVRFKGFGARHAYIIVSENDGSNPYFIRFGPESDAGISGFNGSSSGSGGSSASGGSSSQSSGSTSSSRSGNSSSNSSNSSSTGSSRGGKGKNNGIWGYIDAQYGHYVPDTVDYNESKDPFITIVSGDNKPTSFYKNKFLADAGKIMGANIPYNPFTTNSNASVSEVLKMEGLGGKNTKTNGLAPGWSTDLGWWLK